MQEQQQEQVYISKMRRSVLARKKKTYDSHWASHKWTNSPLHTTRPSTHLPEQFISFYVRISLRHVCLSHKTKESNYIKLSDTYISELKLWTVRSDWSRMILWIQCGCDLLTCMTREYLAVSESASLCPSGTSLRLVVTTSQKTWQHGQHGQHYDDRTSNTLW